MLLILVSPLNASRSRVLPIRFNVPGIQASYCLRPRSCESLSKKVASHQGQQKSEEVALH
jgi:hypothetical protein